jgi:hypothetical protein
MEVGIAVVSDARNLLIAREHWVEEACGSLACGKGEAG